jgi:hypothetical protein
MGLGRLYWRGNRDRHRQFIHASLSVSVFQVLGVRRVSSATYITVFFCIGILAGVLNYLGTWTASVAACGPGPQRSDTFLAVCTQPNFGDFEHAAYLWNLEPSAIRSLQTADVVFLGNSRMQFAFSTHTVDEYFSKNHISYYIFGFGYEESNEFAEQLIRKYHVRPKSYIINADPFFLDKLSDPAIELENASYLVWATYMFKFMFVENQRLICDVPWLCTKSKQAIYRVAANGAWIWQDYWFPGTLVGRPVTGARLKSLTEDELSHAKAIAGKFAARAGVSPECIILTGVPSLINNSEAVAAEIANAANLQVVLPHVDGLSTLDMSHLSAESAERWSSAFIEKMAPVLENCLSRH